MSMNATKQEYLKRLTEINTYLTTFELLDRGSCSLICNKISGESEEREVSDSLSKILKANGFLLLYNLIEATIRRSLVAVFNAVKSENLSYKDLSDKMRDLWIKQETKSIQDINQNRSKIKELAEAVLNNLFLEIKPDTISISGNIDAREIRHISEQIGCSTVADGRKLKSVKDNRNKLAHGEKSFSEMGRDISVIDLIQYRDEVKIYLDAVLTQVENYINSKGYKHHA